MNGWPSDPFRLSAHLEDDHELPGQLLGPLDADALRQTHRDLHDGRLEGHHHDGDAP